MRDKQSEEFAAQVVSALMAVRKERGVSHEKLADMTGLSRATISFIENEKRKPKLETCLKIAKALDEDLAVIINKCRK